LDGFEVYAWSVQTAQLLDSLKGHEGPISAVAFHPLKSYIASASWDATVRLWDLFGSNQLIETFRHESEVLAVAFSPSGRQLCTATMDGSLNFWDMEKSIPWSTIEGRRDITGGRTIGSARTAKTSEAGKYFTT
jgi:periodic tryptophan protein 2